MKQEKQDPYTLSFNKLYLVNMLTKRYNIVCNDYVTAERLYPNICKMIEKLSGKEITMLINSIEYLT